VYQKVATIEVQGVRKEDEIVVYALDYRHLDQTLLTPLWAGVPGPEQADRLVKKSIIHPKKFWRNFGLAACATVPAPEVKRECDSVWIPWNCLVGDGLVDYGYSEAASELVSRMMDAITGSLKKSGAFRKHYDAQTGEGIGERNAVLGLPPLDLFLRTLGVQIYSIWRVRLTGRNPFPWTVVVRFRGLEIRRRLDSTEVTFPNGETVLVESPEPTVVEGRSGE
jgi:neutral trehalase